ncbi:ejaculatory bulb-specific protein 2 [Drosophila rhopaloa]|uniref:Ejaculatory bulb-specific protein 2 n=1 Tax=Drosophila rhopaloa TaxID=1041015 RepID=A0A6P4EBD2_DRORH|nr:ejaculatory bulb-specific protein 2 [Drosophila rhopaloa]
MIRLLVFVIALTLMTGGAFGAIDQLIRAITGGFGGGARVDLPINRRYTVGAPNGEISFGYGYRPVFY